MKKTAIIRRTALIVSGESGYFTVSELAGIIESYSYYEGYNPNTVEWLKNQNGVCVPSQEGFVIMSKAEADSIPIESVTDVMIEDTISCEIIESHSIGEGLKDIVLVKNVELVSRNETASWA